MEFEKVYAFSVDCTWSVESPRLYIAPTEKYSSLAVAIFECIVGGSTKNLEEVKDILIEQYASEVSEFKFELDIDKFKESCFNKVYLAIEELERNDAQDFCINTKCWDELFDYFQSRYGMRLSENVLILYRPKYFT